LFSFKLRLARLQTTARYAKILNPAETGQMGTRDKCSDFRASRIGYTAMLLGGAQGQTLMLAFGGK
jgi:hypothetical protein